MARPASPFAAESARADCRAAAESTASRSLTTHSSPCDVGDDDELVVRLHDGAKRDAALYNYQSVETPRAAAAERASIRSLQIQIEGARQLSGDFPTPTRRRWCARRRDKPSAAAPERRRLLDLLVPALVVVGPPAVVLVLLHFSVAYTMILVLNVAVALAGWEWSWWSFRIRQRLLVPFVYADTSTALEHHTSIDELQDDMLNQEVLAVKKIAAKWCRGRKYLAAFAIALVTSAVVVVIVACCADWIIPEKKSTIGRRVLISSTTTGMLSGVFCACLTPTAADGFIVVVYMACFVVSSLNSFLAHHEHLVHDPELLDSLYVLLVGACAIVVARIVSSKEVMESTMMAMLDILGLAYLVAPMMAMADFLGHPTVKDYGDVVGTFFVVVSAAEAAYWLNLTIKEAYPHFLQGCRRPVVKNMSTSLGVESLILSFTFGIVGSIISVLCYHGYIIEWQDALVYLGAIFMSQFCRLAVESMKAMAKLESAKYKPWVGGFIELVNPYMLAMIVFHPYVKALIKK